MVHYEFEYYIHTGDITNISEILLQDRTSRLLLLLLYINMICTFIVVGTIYFRYVLTIKLYQSKHLLSGLDTLVTTDWYKALIMEVLINLITPYPFFRTISIQTTYNNASIILDENLNESLLAVSLMLRIYLAVRFYMTCFSVYRQPRH
mmetsp:Transcript_38602/g.36951  ORF Transcript_38602/g.36951 Transcript_38602/m.36951 type:complete len:149 (+) Transcript_38602:305-751(+)